MRREAGLGLLIGLGLLVLSAWPTRLIAQPSTNSCITCHREIDDERLSLPTKTFGDDIHASKGFGCVICHGGDPTQAGPEAMDPARGFIGVPKHQEIAQICGRCHSDARFMKRYNPALRVDQVAEYYTSVHGQRIREFNDAKVATCTSCHTAHAIKPPGDPQSSVNPLHVAQTCGHCHADAKYMESYGIPTDQLEKYKASVHWQAMSVQGDLSAPTCNDCHGNHGASPPGISWVGNVCGQCHVMVANLFAKSVHATAFVQMGLPGCVACHNNHDIGKPSDEMLGIKGNRAVCTACHSADDRGGKTAAAMRERIDALKTAYDQAHAILSQAEHAGMEVSQPQFELNAAKDSLVKARTVVHMFNLKAMQQETETGLKVSKKAYTQGIEALKEIGRRRGWLAIWVTVIVFLIVGVVLKTRQLERE
jgi:hypothetical protein